MSKFRFLLVLLCLFNGSSLLAQDTLRLTLADALRMAMTQGGEAQALREDSISRASSWKASRNLWLPELTVTATPAQISRDWTPQGTYSRDNQFGTLRLSQDLLFGGTLELWESLGRYESSVDRPPINSSNKYHSGRRGIEYNQPLLSGNPSGRSREKARLDFAIGQLDHLTAIREHEYQVTSSFYSLVSAIASLNISREDLASGRESAELAERKLRAGFIPEVELLQIQVDLARRESTVRDAEGAVESAMDDFRLDLGVEANLYIEPLIAAEDDSLPSPPSPPKLEDRPDARRQKMNLRQRELSLKDAVYGARVDLELQAGYSSSGLFNDFQRSISGVEQEERHIALSLWAPLFDFGATSGKIEASKAGYRAARINHSLAMERLAADQREAFRRLNRAFDRIGIASKALGLSEKSFKITEERFGNGLVNSRELLDAQLDLTRTRNESVRARIDYHLALASIKRFLPEEGSPVSQ
jgi:outer membrane protein TolC